MIPPPPSPRIKPPRPTKEILQCSTVIQSGVGSLLGERACFRGMQVEGMVARATKACVSTRNSLTFHTRVVYECAGSKIYGLGYTSGVYMSHNPSA